VSGGLWRVVSPRYRDTHRRGATRKQASDLSGHRTDGRHLHLQCRFFVLEAPWDDEHLFSSSTRNWAPASSISAAATCPSNTLHSLASITPCGAPRASSMSRTCASSI